MRRRPAALLSVADGARRQPSTLTWRMRWQRRVTWRRRPSSTSATAVRCSGRAGPRWPPACYPSWRPARWHWAAEASHTPRLPYWRCRRRPGRAPAAAAQQATPWQPACCCCGPPACLTAWWGRGRCWVLHLLMGTCTSRPSSRPRPCAAPTAGSLGSQTLQACPCCCPPCPLPPLLAATAAAATVLAARWRRAWGTWRCCSWRWKAGCRWICSCRTWF